MNTKREFTDKQLTAFLDGEADVELVAAINAHLVKDESLSQRLDNLRIDLDGIQDSFDKLLIIAPEMPKLATVQDPALPFFMRHAYKAIAASAILFLVLGSIGGHLFFQQQTPTDWQSMAAAYHSLYVNRTLAHVSRPQEDLSMELAGISSELGKEIDLETLLASKKLNYKRGQVLGHEGKPLIQLAFLTHSGVPVALCITQAKHAQPSTPHIQQLFGMAAATWSDGKFEYLLVGGENRGLVEQEATAFSNRL